MKQDANNHLIKGFVLHDLQIQNRHKIRFDAGENGKLSNAIINTIVRNDGHTLTSIDIPQVVANEGFMFIGWDKNPNDYVLTEDTIFTAKYEKKLPWYKRFWLWLSGSGCLKWLLWLLIIAAILLLLYFLLRGCDGTDTIKSIDKRETSSGEIIDDNDTLLTIFLKMDICLIIM